MERRLQAGGGRRAPGSDRARRRLLRSPGGATTGSAKAWSSRAGRSTAISYPRTPGRRPPVGLPARRRRDDGAAGGAAGAARAFEPLPYRRPLGPGRHGYGRGDPARCRPSGPAAAAVPWRCWAARRSVPLFRELTEMRYLWEQPLRMANDRLVAAIGPEPHTPLDRAVRETLTALACPPRARRRHSGSGGRAGEGGGNQLRYGRMDVHCVRHPTSVWCLGVHQVDQGVHRLVAPGAEDRRRPGLARLSASTRIFINPAVSLFSSARATLVMGRMPTRAPSSLSSEPRPRSHPLARAADR